MRARSVNFGFHLLFFISFVHSVPRQKMQLETHQLGWVVVVVVLICLFHSFFCVLDFFSVLACICIINYVYGYWLSLNFVNESPEKYLILLPSIFDSTECFFI